MALLFTACGGAGSETPETSSEQTDLVIGGDENATGSSAMYQMPTPNELFVLVRDLAGEGHKRMIIASHGSDIFFTAAVDGAPANFLAASLVSAGMSLEALAVTPPGRIVSVKDHKRWKDIWSAGHGVGSIHAIQPAAEVCREIIAQYQKYRIVR